MVGWSESQPSSYPTDQDGMSLVTERMYSVGITVGDTTAMLKSCIGGVVQDSPWLQQDQGISTELYMVAKSTNHYGLQYYDMHP